MPLLFIEASSNLTFQRTKSNLTRNLFYPLLLTICTVAHPFMLPQAKLSIENILCSPSRIATLTNECLKKNGAR